MKKLFVGLLVGVLFVTITGCGSKKISTGNQELDDAINSGKYTIVDVRTTSEYNEGHVKEAINIPYDRIDENVKLDKNNTIIVYCKSGERSKKAAATLKDLGFKVIDLGAYESITLEKE